MPELEVITIVPWWTVPIALFAGMFVAMLAVALLEANGDD